MVPEEEHLSPIGENPEVGTPTPLLAETHDGYTAPTSTRTHTPVPPTRTPRPTNTPVVPTVTPPPLDPTIAPELEPLVADPAFTLGMVEPSESEPDVAGLDSESGVEGAAPPLNATDSTAKTSPTATATAELFAAEVLGSSSLPPVETSSARIGQQRTGYEWIGKMGTTSQLLLLSGLLAIMAMVGGVIVARERERQPR